ncbi:MAG: glycosyl hydrolase [Eubacterium sp.]|uniref:glycosyl hydrolase n=1 Tax=Eubacterium sp. TaxID=142586 RepID=UPI003993BA5D
MGDSAVDIPTRCAHANRKGYKYLLSYNEPDLQGEANKQPSTMILRWRETITNKGNLRLGSPATETFQINSDKWWTPFWNGMSTDDKNNMTFIAVHAYQHYYNNADTALQYLHAIDEIYAKYHKPIWITEFAVADLRNTFSPNNSKHLAQVQEFMKIVLKGLNERNYVERYAWFNFNPTDSKTGASGIFNYDTGKLTTLGQIYANIGNPAGYKAKTYGVSYTTTKSTSIASCAASVPTTTYSPIGKKKSIRYSFRTIKRATQYQVQCSLSKSSTRRKI